MILTTTGRATSARASRLLGHALGVASSRFQTALVGLLAAALLVAPAAPAPGQTSGDAPQEYRVGAKDVLKVTIWGHDDLSRQVVVSADGKFQFPPIGDVRMAGLTPGAIETLLRNLLGKDYLVDPQVSVSAQEYRSQRDLTDPRSPGGQGARGACSSLG